MKNLPPATPLVLAVDAMPRPRYWSTIPTEWYRHIRRVRPDARGKHGEPQSYCNPLACLILDDILQFYRSVEINQNGRLLRCRRFTGDRLVQSYAHWQDRFGASKHEVRDAVELLVQLGLVLCFRATVIDNNGRRYPNRMVFEPVVAVISRITETPAEAPSRIPTLPPEFTIEVAEDGGKSDPDAGGQSDPDAGGKADPDAGGKGGKKRPSEEADQTPLFAESDAEGVPTTADRSAHQGTPPKSTCRGVPESESTHDSNKDSTNRARTQARPHARGGRAVDILDDLLNGKRPGSRTRASPRRASPKTPSEKKPVTDMRFREAGALVAEWELLQARAAASDGRSPEEDLEKRATSWRWTFYRLLEGVPADDIRWTLERAARLQYPLAWPRRFEEAWHYLSDPSSNPLPWRGALAYNPAIRALEEANERLRVKAQDTENWTPPEGYVRADDLFASFQSAESASFQSAESASFLAEEDSEGDAGKLSAS